MGGCATTASLVPAPSRTTSLAALALEGVTKRFRNGVVVVNHPYPAAHCVNAPADAPSLLIGGWVFAAAAVALGTLSRTPKLFAGIALLFIYVVMSSGHAPEFDFAGWNGVADKGVRTAYLLTAMLFAVLAVVGERRTSRAEG